MSEEPEGGWGTEPSPCRSPPPRGPGDRTSQPHVLGPAQPSASLCTGDKVKDQRRGQGGRGPRRILDTPPLAAGALGAG